VPGTTSNATVNRRNLPPQTAQDPNWDSAQPLPERSPTVPLLCSIAAHLAILAGIAWAWQTPSQGTVEKSVRSVGLAVAFQRPDRTRYATAEQESRTPDDSNPNPPKLAAESNTASSGSPHAANRNASEGSSTASSPASSNPPAEYTPPFDLDGVLAQLSGTDVGASQTSREQGVAAGVARFDRGVAAEQLGQDDLVPGEARAGGGAGQTTTSVFGVTGKGSTFVYVFDRSESMTGAALRRAKEELNQSLRTLTEHQQFQIIFYNHRPRAFSPDGARAGLVLGEPSVIDRATRYVDSIVAVGGTEHGAALKMAFRLAPDVVFFLTDAKIQTMSDAEMDQLSRRAEDAGTVLHGIQFGSGPEPGNSFLKQLAKRNRGGYQYLDVTGFR